MINTNEKISVLTNFLNNLENTNLICRQDVISLEETINENVISNFKETIYFSTDKSDLYVEMVKQKVRDSLKDAQLASTITIKDAVEMYNSLKAEIVHTFLDNTNMIKSKINSEVLYKLNDDSLLLNFEPIPGDPDGNGIFVSNRNNSIIFVLDKYELLQKLSSYFTNPEKQLIYISNNLQDTRNMIDSESISSYNIFTNKYLNKLLELFSKPMQSNFNLLSGINTDEVVNSKLIDVDEFLNIANKVTNIAVTKDSILSHQDAFKEFYTLQQEDMDDFYYSAKRIIDYLRSKEYQILMLLLSCFIDAENLNNK